MLRLTPASDLKHLQEKQAAMTASGEHDRVCCICGSPCPDTPPSARAQNRIICVRCSARGAKPPPLSTPVATDDDGEIGIEGIDESQMQRIVQSESIRASGADTVPDSGGSTPPPPPPHKPGPFCPYCKYDLAGLRATVCPECGKTVKFKDSRKRMKAMNDLEFKAYSRRQALRAGIMLFAGLLIMVIVRIAQGNPGWLADDFTTAGLAAAAGALVFYLYCLIWAGFDAPAWLAILRLAGIYSVLAAVWTLFFPSAVCFLPIPSCLYAFAVPSLMVAALALLLQSEAEMELADGGIIAILSAGAIIATISIANHLGL